jgi:thiamine-monophosphate kinase
MAGAIDPAAITLAELGENTLVARLVRGLPSGGDVLVGPGDDCAVIGRPRDKTWMLLKTDCVIERVHFSPEEDLRRVGWKALCRAISDVAAMGGEPRHALITIAAVRTEKAARLKALYVGLRKAARRFAVRIVGGETARSDGPLFINVALTGSVARGRCVLRSGGKPGDALYVTGRLGGSLAGKHLDFIPRLDAADWLTANFRLHAMMDLSDGLAADLPRLAHASRCGFELWEEKIPRTRGCTVAQALNDGEDYELLFAIAAGASAGLEASWRKHFSKLPLTRIGVLTRRSTIQQPPSTRHGFDHFA